jgi:DNA-binding LacI/PurR family transcriptional regulator
MSEIDELVRVSGYSRSTVFRYLAGKPVRPAAADAIRTAARAVGFRREAPAPREDATILLSVPPDFRGFRGFADAAEGVMRRAAERGVPVVFDDAHAGGRRVAVVVLGMGEREEDEERKIRRDRGEPCVLINRMVEGADASWASVDFRAAAAEAVERLAAAGCRRIACFAPGENRRVDKQKAEGAARALSGTAGSEPRPEFALVDPAGRTAEEAAREALDRSDRPDGWLALSDEDAMRVIRAADGLGFRVPADLSVVGMNDTEGAAYFSPAITTIRVPFAACGEAAVDAALRLLDYPDELSVRITLRHALIERESCAPVR